MPNSNCSNGMTEPPLSTSGVLGNGRVMPLGIPVVPEE